MYLGLVVAFRNMYNISVGESEWKKIGLLPIDRKVVLKWISEYAFIWRRLGFNGGCCEHGMNIWNPLKEANFRTI